MIRVNRSDENYGEQSMDNSLTTRLQAEIGDKLKDAFELVIQSKNRYYEDNPSAIPTVEQIPALISQCATMNSAVSGAASLAPGPLGMLTVVPEIIIVSRNQIALIYDIAAARGQREMIVPETLIAVFLSALGTSAGAIAVAHGNRLIVRRASLRAMQKLIQLLGGNIAQKALKSMVSKWLPVVGAAAMAAWTNFMTRQIGRKADETFKMQIVNDPTTVDVDPHRDQEQTRPEPLCDSGPVLSDSLIKLLVLTRLAAVDGSISDVERQDIHRLATDAGVSEAEKQLLLESMESGVFETPDLARIASSAEDSVALLSAMVALAKKDESLHLAEKLYLRQVGAKLGFTQADVDEALAS